MSIQEKFEKAVNVIRNLPKHGAGEVLASALHAPRLQITVHRTVAELLASMALRGSLAGFELVDADAETQEVSHRPDAVPAFCFTQLHQERVGRLFAVSDPPAEPGDQGWVIPQVPEVVGNEGRLRGVVDTPQYHLNLCLLLEGEGTYQPSFELQLRFYALYKQATEGINQNTRPAFWDLVKRKKYDAWSELGHMSKEQAMICYVEELRKIVETMSYTENVAMFVNSLDDFCENIPAADLEMLVGPIIKQIRSRPNSPLSGSPLATSRDTSPSRLTSDRQHSSTISQETDNHVVKSENDTDEEEDFLDTEMGTDLQQIANILKEKPLEKYELEPLTYIQKYKKVTETYDNETSSGAVTVSSKERNTNTDTPSHNLLPESSTAASGNPKDTTGMEDSAGRILVPERAKMKQEWVEMKQRLQSVEDILKTENLINVYTRGNLASEDRDASLDSPDSNVYKRVVVQLGREIDIIRLRMTEMEEQMHREVQKRRQGESQQKHWELGLRTTLLLMAWPILIIFITKWICNKQKH